MSKPAGKYLKDICPKCKGHLIEDHGMHFFDIKGAILFMKCEECGFETIDIGVSRNWKWKQRYLAEKKKEEMDKRRMSLF